MLKKLSLEKVELLLASALALIVGIVRFAPDLPYTVPCTFFFGEPDYPLDEE